MAITYTHDWDDDIRVEPDTPTDPLSGTGAVVVKLGSRLTLRFRYQADAEELARSILAVIGTEEVKG